MGWGITFHIQTALYSLKRKTGGTRQWDSGIFLMVQRLRLCTPNAGGPDSILGQRTRSHELQLRIHLLWLKIPTKEHECHNESQRSWEPHLRPGTAKWINRFSKCSRTQWQGQQNSGFPFQCHAITGKQLQSQGPLFPGSLTSQCSPRQIPANRLWAEVCVSRVPRLLRNGYAFCGVFSPRPRGVPRMTGQGMVGPQNVKILVSKLLCGRTYKPNAINYTQVR